MTSQKNFQELHKDAKEIIPKEPIRYFLFIQTNYQRTRNQHIFVSKQKFDHKKKILAIYDGLLA